MSWTDERIESLRNMWEKGLTASQIADELGGVSRNAVIGKAHRLGLKSRPSPVKATEKVAKPAKVAARMAQWFREGWCRNAVFNLKLPMKKRWQETRLCLELFAGQAGTPLTVRARQLYHDREEITVFATPAA